MIEPSKFYPNTNNDSHITLDLIVSFVQMEHARRFIINNLEIVSMNLQ